MLSIAFDCVSDKAVAINTWLPNESHSCAIRLEGLRNTAEVLWPLVDIDEVFR